MIDEERIRGLIAEILSQPRFQGGEASAPGWRERLFRWLVELVLSIADLLGGPLTAGIITLTLVVLAGIVVTLNLGRRRSREVEARTVFERMLARGTDPDQLERLADLAAARGNHAEAIRLLFVSGLLRLDHEGRLSFNPGTPTSDYSLALASPAFDRLAGQFDLVVYGRRAVASGDLAASRRDWGEVLTRARV
jgi:hypothetical protein